jgi:hypothetical protein
MKTLAVALIGMGCIAAAAGGAYLATRQNAADVRIDSAAGAGVPSADQTSTPPAPDVAAKAPGAPAPTPELAAAADTTARTLGANSAMAPIAKVPAAKASRPTSSKPVAAIDPLMPAAPAAAIARPLSADEPPPPPVAATPPPPVTTSTEVPPPPPEPPKPQYLELTIAAQSVIGIRLDTSVSTDTAKIEDKVTAHVTRDVMVSGHAAIPAGARLEGSVTAVDRGGKFKDHARLGEKFHTRYFADGTRVPLQTETIFREDDTASSAAASKVGGGAVVGAILGALLGGKKGAVVGSTAGAGAGTAAGAAGKGNEATLTAGMNLTVRLTSPATVTIEKLNMW